MCYEGSRQQLCDFIAWKKKERKREEGLPTRRRRLFLSSGGSDLARSSCRHTTSTPFPRLIPANPRLSFPTPTERRESARAHSHTHIQGCARRELE